MDSLREIFRRYPEADTSLTRPGQVAPLCVRGRELERQAVAGGGLSAAAEPPQQVRARGGQQVVAGQGAARVQLLDEAQPGRGVLGHRDGNGPIERDDRRRGQLAQPLVPERDLRPFGCGRGGRGPPRSRVPFKKSDRGQAAWRVYS